MMQGKIFDEYGQLKMIQSNELISIYYRIFYTKL